MRFWYRPANAASRSARQEIQLIEESISTPWRTGRMGCDYAFVCVCVRFGTCRKDIISSWHINTQSNTEHRITSIWCNLRLRSPFSWKSDKKGPTPSWRHLGAERKASSVRVRLIIGLHDRKVDARCVLPARPVPRNRCK